MAESIPSRVTCEQATALLLDYVSGTLDPATTLIVDRHLARCDDCVAFLQTYKETIRATRILHYDDMPAALQDRLFSFLHTRLTHAPQSFPGGRDQR
jgi:anti-sigma factor RsiW